MSAQMQIPTWNRAAGVCVALCCFGIALLPFAGSLLSGAGGPLPVAGGPLPVAGGPLPVAGGPLPVAGSVRQDTERAFIDVHAAAVVSDGHNDLLHLLVQGARADSRRSEGHSDLDRFDDGGVDVQVFSVWVPTSVVKRGESYAYGLREIDALDALVARNPLRIAKVTRGRELDSAVAHGRLAAILSLEGGETAGSDGQNIPALYRRGVRLFGLTWNTSTAWALSADDEANGSRAPGISARGKRLLHRLDSLGILIDVSHLSARGFDDVLATTKNPVIASHSSCAALRPHRRNLTDDQLRRLAARGGVVMITFVPGFLRSDAGGTTDACNAANRTLRAASTLATRFLPEALRRRDRFLVSDRISALPGIRDVADHIDHAVAVAGIDHVGLGSDFDGIDAPPVGLADVADYPFLTRELLRRGYSPADTRSIMGGNFVRVFRQVCGQ